MVKKCCDFSEVKLARDISLGLEKMKLGATEEVPNFTFLCATNF